jgi:HlyD family secretion protein
MESTWIEESSMKRFWLGLGVLLGVGVIGAAGYLGLHNGSPSAEATPPAPVTIAVNTCNVTQTVTGTGSVASTGNTVVRMPFSASIKNILVKPGDRVQAGQELAQLNQADVLMAVAQAQTAVVTAQAALQKAQSEESGLSQPRTGNLSIERAALELANAQDLLNKAQAAYNEVSGYAEDDPRRLYKLESLLAAKQAYDHTLANYNWFTGHPSNLDVSAADAKVSLDEATLAQAQDKWNELNSLFVSGTDVTAAIKAPISGIVLEVKAASGAPTDADAPLFTLVDPKSIEIAVTVTEEDFPYINVGQSAQMYFDALPDVEASGKVSRILPQRAQGTSPLYYVYISLDSIPDKLVDGMTSDASILIAEKKQVLCLPRALVHASVNGTATVTVWDGTQTETRQITVGMRGDTNIEILSGLKVGDLVVSQ